MRFQIRLTFEKRATEKTAKIVIKFFLLHFVLQKFAKTTKKYAFKSSQVRRFMFKRIGVE